MTTPPTPIRPRYQPVLTCSWKANTPHRIDTIGSVRVRPGCAATSWPAFIADWTRNIAPTPVAIIAYSCQLVIRAAIPWEKTMVTPFIRAAVSPNAAPAPTASTAA